MGLNVSSHSPPSPLPTLSLSLLLVVPLSLLFLSSFSPLLLLHSQIFDQEIKTFFKTKLEGHCFHPVLAVLSRFLVSSSLSSSPASVPSSRQQSVILVTHAHSPPPPPPPPIEELFITLTFTPPKQPSTHLNHH